MDKNTILCYCKNISLEDIFRVIDNGASTTIEILDATGAGTSCGRCIDRIEDVIESIIEKK
ncbi:bacterioferritin-associated ferredoxin [uncultured Cetobacterium sp.]|uniref:(2Fe-2S)-binding protein n=1 Tax=uncultured Cetobacterium sp. TaxID=527638 RepID=UPI002610E306|nr:(2Fe-2S)-binding protein [uncultured Cetobacterium sp.]